MLDLIGSPLNSTPVSLLEKRNARRKLQTSLEFLPTQLEAIINKTKNSNVSMVPFFCLTSLPPFPPSFLTPFLPGFSLSFLLILCQRLTSYEPDYDKVQDWLHEVHWCQLPWRHVHSIGTQRRPGGGGGGGGTRRGTYLFGNAKFFFSGHISRT